MSTCVPDTCYFASSEFLSLALHCMSVIEIPIHFFGAYIIIFHTPLTMSSVKWPMLNLHFWSSFLDISISTLTIPYLLFPAIAGYPLGVLSMFPSTVGAQCHFIVTLIGLVAVSILMVYENRFYLIIREDTFWKRFRFYYMTISYFLATFFMFPFSLVVPEQKSAVRTVFERLPCLPQYVYEGPVFVYTLDVTPVFITIIILLFLVIGGIVIFITKTISHLLQTTRKNSLSKKTMNIQKKFLFGLVIQTTIPVLVVLCPIGYLVVTLPKGYYNQVANNFLVITMSFHGVLSTVAMLLMHKAYRTAAFDVLIPCCNRNVSDDTVKTTMVQMKKFNGKVDCA